MGHFLYGSAPGWRYAYTPHIWPSVFTLLLLAVLAVYSWRRLNLPGAMWFTIYCLLGLPYLAAKIVGYLAVDFETKIYWFNLESPWWLPGTTALTCFILEYAWPGRWIKRRTIAVLFIIPLIRLAFIATNRYHHLSFIGYGFNGSVVPLYGPVGWAFLAYNLGLRVVSVTALVWLFARSPQHRWPAVMIMLAEIVVGVLLVLDPLVQESWFLYLPEKAIPVVACAVALFAFRIFDPIPLAKQTVIDQLQTSMVVLDLDGRAVSLNPAAERFLNAPAKRIKGRRVNEWLPDYPDACAASSGEKETELCVRDGAGFRWYTISNSMLKDFRGLEVGSLLLIRDETDKKLTQARILEQQRALSMLREREHLARELHDNLGQVFSFFNAQIQTIQRLLDRGDLSTANDHLDRLLEVTHEVDRDIRETIAGLRATLSDRRLIPTLKLYLARFEMKYGIHAHLEGAEKITDGLLEPLAEAHLMRILQEALTNVRKHANARQVRITFELEDGWARVAVRDDGQGFDPGLISPGMEDHIGLRVMRERAEEVGGSLSLTSAPGRGTELVVRIPVNGDRHA